MPKDASSTDTDEDLFDGDDDDAEEEEHDADEGPPIVYCDCAPPPKIMRASSPSGSMGISIRWMISECVCTAYVWAIDRYST